MATSTLGLTAEQTQPNDSGGKIDALTVINYEFSYFQTRLNLTSETEKFSNYAIASELVSITYDPCRQFSRDRVVVRIFILF